MRPTRTLLSLSLLCLAAACSSGLGQNGTCSTAAVGSVSGNLTTGLFLGFPLQSPVTEIDAAGGVIPGQTLLGDRYVVFQAFVTSAPADDAGAPGAGSLLDRDGAADTNASSDVFVATVVDRKINTSAFSYSLAGKFRHPRCMSCHSLAEADTTVFAITAHPGLPPGDPGLQNVQESAQNLCMKCHRFALNELEDQGGLEGFAWRNPPTALDSDFRKLSTAGLAQRARNAPNNHFSDDRRVGWALSSGIFTEIHPDFAANPYAPEATGIVIGGADDDQDGTAEAADIDGRRRTVPGGRAAFLTEVDSFLCGGPTDTRGAICDVALASRRVATREAGSGVSSQPAVTYVPDDAYVGGNLGSTGALYVAYTSTANDVVAGVIGASKQVYRASFDVQLRADGGVELVYLTTVLVTPGAGTGGNNQSGSPSISADGDRIAFDSLATDLVAGGTPTEHVYVYEVSTISTVRVTQVSASNSHTPAIDATGTVVAFESLHDFEGGSPSSLADIYYSELGSPVLSAMAPLRASQPNVGGGTDVTGASRDASVVRAVGGEIFVAFASVNDLDTFTLGDPVPAENVYVHRDNLGVRTTVLVSAAHNALGVTELPDGSSRAPCFVGTPDLLMIETDATNMDSTFLLPPDPTFGVTTFKSGDENGAADIVMLDLAGFVAGTGPILAEAVSVSPAGAFGDRGSFAPVAGSFAAPVGATPPTYLGFAGMLTRARNIGAEDNHAGLLPADATPWVSFLR